jgi:predicted transcriptional regulator
MTLSEPIVGEQFFGRDEALSLLKKRVNALTEGYRQNVALTGQNLAGKSSILHHFLYNFHDNRILPIYVEITDEPFIYFAQRFTGSLLYNLLRSKGEEPKEDFEMLVEEAKPFIPSTVKSIREIQDLARKRDFDNAYSLLFDLTSIVKEETGRSCVIILDEFHNLASLNVRHPFKNFGKKIMVQKDTMYIVTSSQVTTVKKILNEKLALLFGNFEVIQVKGFTSKNASTFLDQRFKYMRVPSDFKNFIISFTEGNPFYLDVLSQSVKDVVATMTFKRVTQEILIQALEKTIFNSKGCVFQYLNGSLETLKQERSSEIYISILLAVAKGSCRLKEISKVVKKRVGDVSRYINDLIEMNILYKNGSFYKFVDKMFGFWFKYVYQKKRSAIISYLPDRIRIFGKEMGYLIDNFIAQEKQEMLTRVADLFNLFNNEAVSIAGKECKLSSFSSIDIKYFDNGVPYILAKAHKKFWLIQASLKELKDIDIIEFAENCRALKLKIQKKILIALSGIEINAHLLAKEENMWIWSMESINQVMMHYGKDMMIKPICREKDRGMI